MTAFDQLMAFQHETEALAQIAGRLGWDQETEDRRPNDE